MPIAHNLGFPPLGPNRELKRATEGYWSGKVSRTDLLRTGAALRAAHWGLQRDAGLDLIPSNDFSYYDPCSTRARWWPRSQRGTGGRVVRSTSTPTSRWRGACRPVGATSPPWK